MELIILVIFVGLIFLAVWHYGKKQDVKSGKGGGGGGDVLPKKEKNL